jgi:hypothetical protein
MPRQVVVGDDFHENQKRFSTFFDCKEMIMKKLNLMAGCLFTVVVAINANYVAGQQHVRAQDEANHQHDGHDHGEHIHSTESLAFHLPEWKSMHFDDRQKAAQHAEAIEKLGCEVKQENHAGHIDVSYRCVSWRSMEVASHELAEQWNQWLASSGFDVSHGHTDPVFAKGDEVVKFRLVAWKSLHGSGAPEEAQFVEQLKKMGCEVRVEEHKDHSDVHFRAPTWRDIHLADHASAEQWIAWLQQNGFETDHQH